MATSFRVGAVACAVLALGACSSVPEARWRVEPMSRVDDARSSAPTGNAAGHLALARQYEGERRFEQALQSYRQAAQAAPWDVDVLTALGVAEAGQGHLDRAVAVLRRAAALAPMRASVLNNLGYVLLLDGRPAEAREVLVLALQRQPEHARARENLAQADKALSDTTPSSPTTSPTPAPAPTLAAHAAASPVAAQQPPQAAMQVIHQPTVPPLQASAVAALPQPVDSAARPRPPEATATPGFTPMAATASPRVAATASSRVSHARVEISNGNGVRGMASWLAGWLRERGVQGHSRLTNLRPYTTETTVVHYREGFAEQARDIARRMPASVQLALDPQPAPRSDVRIVLGQDLRTPAVVTMLASR